MSLLNDLRYAARTLLRSPGFACVTILTLALGLGATVAVFSVVNALILRPYPFPALERLVLLRTGDDRSTVADYLDLERELRSFQQLAAFRYLEVNLTAADQSENIFACAVSPDFFAITGIQPAIGRAFRPEESQEGRKLVVVLGDRFWKGQLGGDPQIVGKTVKLNGVNHTVVGIMPAGFNYPVGADVWIPLAFTAKERPERAMKSLLVLGRLRREVSLEQARTELSGIANRLAERYPQTNSTRKFTLIRLREEQYSYTTPLFLTLQAAAVLVLLLACSNLTNLMLARAISREREIAVRAALGGSRTRIVQMIMGETLLLAAAGALIATVTSFWTVDLIRTSMAPGFTKWIAGWDNMRVDATVVWATTLISIAAAVVLGLTSAFTNSRADMNEMLKESSGRLTGGLRVGRARRILAASQIVLALVLLTGAGSLIAEFRRLMNVYQALEPGRLLKLNVALSGTLNPDNAHMISYFDLLLAGLRSLPGVRAAGVGSNVPASNVENRRVDYLIEGRPAPKPGEMPVADIMTVSPGFLESLRAPVLEGRAISDRDGAESQRIVVVSQSFARHEWPAGNAVGRRLRIVRPGSPEAWVTIVGVIGDLKQNWWDAKPLEVIYLPFAQAPQRSMRLLARTTVDPLTLAHAVRTVAGTIDPDTPLSNIQTLNTEVVDAMAPIQIIASLTSVFGALALALAGIGIYGLLAFGVAQRTREFGMRIALGATPRDLFTVVIVQAVKLTSAGIVLGVPLSVALIWAMRGALFGTASVSAGTIAGFAAVELAAAVAAGCVPALRAMGVDPLEALRSE